MVDEGEECQLPQHQLCCHCPHASSLCPLPCPAYFDAPLGSYKYEQQNIKYPCAAPGSCKVDISNMYITYTFLYPGMLAGLLILNIFRTVVYLMIITNADFNICKHS